MSVHTRTAVDLFHEYRLDFEAALNPCIMCLIDRCPEGEREALDALLDEYLMYGPLNPPYSPVQSRRLHDKMMPIVDRVMSDPAVMAQQDQIEAAWRDKPWWRKAWIRTRSKVMWRWITRPRPFQKKPWE